MCYAMQYDRQTALADFTAGRVSVLVATDVASRGLDIKGIGHVINCDLPKTFEDYVHRIGAANMTPFFTLSPLPLPFTYLSGIALMPRIATDSSQVNFPEQFWMTLSLCRPK
jgi:hypothetical protein